MTGGGTGLGREMAEAFVKLGATVYICGRRQGKLDETAEELMDAHGGKVVAHACDIRDADAINAMIDAIWADGGALTGVVNNAAGNFISRTEDLSVNGFNAIADIVFREHSTSRMMLVRGSSRKRGAATFSPSSQPGYGTDLHSLSPLPCRRARSIQ